jgi:hypothetical protein
LFSYNAQGAGYYSSAGNGASGGDGGDAGRGSSGANGGAGGAIEIKVTDTDTYLLMLVHGCSAPDSLVHGGTGGTPGRHGKAGQGGAGGRGGYGNGFGKHYKPPGNVGPRGRSGRSANAALCNGDHGPNGTFQIHVANQGMTKSYPYRYDIICRHVELMSAQALPGSNVFQFSDTVGVNSFVVENMGPMPTPMEPIQCYIQSNKNIFLRQDTRAHIQNRLAPALLLEDHEDHVRASLAAASRTTICDRMSFQATVPDIRSMDVDMKPYRLPLTLHLGALQLGPNRFACAYENFHKDGAKVEFRFPVQNTKGLEGLSSIEAGATTRIAFEIENISKSDLGAKSESRRQLFVQFYLNSDPRYDVASEHIALVVNGTQCQSLQLSSSDRLLRGTSFPIDLLRSKSTVTLDGLLTFSPKAAPYSKLGLQAEILLQNLSASDEKSEFALYPVQRRQLVIASEPSFCPASSDNAILVTSASTTRPQFNAWRDLLTSRMGLSVGYFSVSIYGSLSPDFQVSNGATLRQEFRGKLIVVLDESFQPVSEGSAATNPSRLLPNGAMAQCSGFDPSTQWLFIASSKESVDHLTSCHFMATAHDVRSFDSVFGYFAAKRASLKKERLQGTITDLEIMEEKIRVPAAWGNLQRVVNMVTKWLKKRDVLRQYIISVQRNSTTRTTLGWIFVRRGYCLTSNTVRIIQQMESHETSCIVDGGSMLFSTLQSCPADTQISLYCRAVRSGQLDIAQNLRHVFVLSLLSDLHNFMEGKLHLKGAQCGQPFPTLSTLLASKEMEELTKEAPVGTTDSAIVSSISALFAGLCCVANSKDLRPWWSPWSREHAVCRTLSKLVNQIATKWDHALQDIAVKKKKDELEAAVTVYIRQSLAMPRVSGQWQKGLLHVVTPCEVGESSSPDVAVRLMERLPRKEVMNISHYQTLQKTAEQRQRQTIELSMTIQVARAKATVKTEMGANL